MTKNCKQCNKEFKNNEKKQLFCSRICYSDSMKGNTKGFKKGKKLDKTIIGKKFGRLIVISFDHTNKKNRQSYWKCICDCGNKKTIRRDCLISNRTQSCGCLIKEHTKLLKIKPFGESTKIEAWGNFQRGAKLRGYENKLTFQEWQTLSKQNCFYCGNIPSNIQKSNFSNGDFIYNGIDRLKNNLGYIIGNVVACCYTCNKMKMVLDDKEFILQIKKINKHLCL